MGQTKFCKAVVISVVVLCILNKRPLPVESAFGLPGVDLLRGVAMDSVSTKARLIVAADRRKRISWVLSLMNIGSSLVGELMIAGVTLAKSGA